MDFDGAAERHRIDLFHLSTRARTDLSGFLYQIKDLPVAEVRNLLTTVMPELVQPYLSAADELAATWYEDLRRAVGARGTFYPQSFTPSVQNLQANAVARWAVDPLVPQETTSAQQDAYGGQTLVPTLTEPDPDAVIRRLAGAVQRMIYDASRGLVEGNAVRDPARTGYQRVARTGCCAFCGMLASRGAVYRTETAGGRVVGRGKDVSASFNADGSRKRGGLAGGVKARGEQVLGNTYHDHCHCVVMPVFVGTELAEVARIERDRFQQLYDEAKVYGPDGTVDLDATLAAWRQTNHTH